MHRHVLLGPVTRTFGHDLIFWYPVWQFYAEGLSLGELRLWNPFSYGGVALYPALLQLRAFDPVTALVVAVGHLLTTDLLARYNWEIFLRAIVPAVTAYVFLRRFAVEPATRVALLVAVLGSSFLFVLLRVHGSGQGFLWASIIGILLYRLLWLGDGRWRVFAALAVFLGLNWQSYFIVPHGLFAAVFALGLLVCDPGRVRRVLMVERLLPKLGLAALLLGVMAVPLAVVMSEGDEVVYLTRLFDTGRPADKVGQIQYESVPSSAVCEVGVLARNRRSPSALRIDDRPGGCYLGIPLGGAVRISKAVHPPPNRGNSKTNHPRWVARVDGRPAPVLRANYLAQAVPVPSGRHRVELSFEPGIFYVAVAG